MITNAGTLPCSKIFHVVGPQWQSDEQPLGSTDRKEDRELASCVWKSLAEADKRGYRSLALPAISAGSYGFPLMRCASTIVQTHQTYFASQPQSTIKEVRLISVQEDVVDAFSTAMSTTLGMDHVQLYEKLWHEQEQGDNHQL